MALIGFLTSWPTPEVSRPIAAMRRESSSSDSICFHRFQIVQRHQRAQALPCVVVVDEINRRLDAPSGLCANLFLHQGTPASKASRRVLPSTVEGSKISRA